jgi:hypothetical protein
MYIHLVLDYLNDFVHRKPHYRIIPALIFSSNPSCLALVHQLLHCFDRRFHIRVSYWYHFDSLYGNTENVIDSRSFNALRCMPQSQISWSSDLAIAMKLVLRLLVGLSKPSQMLYCNPHRQWLQRKKPRKQVSLGSPKLSSTFLSILMHPGQPRTGTFDWSPSKSYMLFRLRAWRIQQRRMKYRTLLKAVIFYLHKSDRSSQVAEMARKSLPKAALCFPNLMKRARAKMDAYVQRWDGKISSLLITYILMLAILESIDSLLQKAQSLSIDDID